VLARILACPLIATLAVSDGSAVAPPSPSTPALAPFTLSHAWIVVAPGAPERAALEKAGFRIAPTVNRHDGQGTAWHAKKMHDKEASP
jgi:hypothetical protein